MELFQVEELNSEHLRFGKVSLRICQVLAVISFF
jgi:hypothetical protein